MVFVTVVLPLFPAAPVPCAGLRYHMSRLALPQRRCYSNFCNAWAALYVYHIAGMLVSVATHIHLYLSSQLESGDCAEGVQHVLFNTGTCASRQLPQHHTVGTSTQWHCRLPHSGNGNATQWGPPHSGIAGYHTVVTAMPHSGDLHTVALQATTQW